MLVSCYNIGDKKSHVSFSILTEFAAQIPYLKINADSM